MSTGTAYSLDPGLPDLEAEIEKHARLLRRGMNLMAYSFIGVAWYPNRVEVFRFAQTGSGPSAYQDFTDEARAALHFRFVALGPYPDPAIEAEMKALEH
jgi:hypothetical protein